MAKFLIAAVRRSMHDKKVRKVMLKAGEFLETQKRRCGICHAILSIRLSLRSRNHPILRVLTHYGRTEFRLSHVAA